MNRMMVMAVGTEEYTIFEPQLQTFSSLHTNLHRRTLSSLSTTTNANTKSGGPRRRLSRDAQWFGQELDDFDPNQNLLVDGKQDSGGDSDRSQACLPVDEIQVEFVKRFDSPQIRAVFLRKVLAIVGLQLLIVTSWTIGAAKVPPIERFVRDHPWIAFGAIAVYCALYFAVALMRIGRRFPANLVILFLFTATLGYICGYITLKYTTWTVMLSVGATATICLVLYVVTLLTKLDITGWGIYLTTACCLMMLYAASVLTCSYILTDSKTMSVLNVTGAFFGATLVSVYLLYDLQMMMGGRSREIDSEEWLFAAMALFYDLVMIFVYLLQIIGVVANRPAPAPPNQESRPMERS